MGNATPDATELLERAQRHLHADALAPRQDFPRGLVADLVSALRRATDRIDGLEKQFVATEDQATAAVALADSENPVVQGLQEENERLAAEIEALRELGVLGRDTAYRRRDAAEAEAARYRAVVEAAKGRTKELRGAIVKEAGPPDDGSGDAEPWHSLWQGATSILGALNGLDNPAPSDGPQDERAAAILKRADRWLCNDCQPYSDGMEIVHELVEVVRGLAAATSREEALREFVKEIAFTHKYPSDLRYKARAALASTPVLSHLPAEEAILTLDEDSAIIGCASTPPSSPCPCAAGPPGDYEGWLEDCPIHGTPPSSPEPTEHWIRVAIGVCDEEQPKQASPDAALPFGHIRSYLELALERHPAPPSSSREDEAR